MILHRKICTSSSKFSRSRTARNCWRLLSTNVTEWKSRVGLEIHAQIATKTKLFSGASTNFASPINSSVALFDCATPGTLPVLNRKCVESAVLTALALSCELNEVSMFERKHYFYGDLPAGFQITQQKTPLAVNGQIRFSVFTPGVHKIPYMVSSKIKQIQLEQDSGKSLHHECDARSLIDLNRAGIPLMELVFEPDLKDGEEAAALVKELIMIFELLGTCSCKMEEGALRVDANVSVSKDDTFGVRTEIKNIGTVRAVASAINYEIKRHSSILNEGGQIFNETLTWNASKKKTTLLREKEEKQDYRFMPETNLPPLYLHVNENTENIRNLVDVTCLKKQIPTLPEGIRHKLHEIYGISQQLVLTLMSDLKLIDLFSGLMEDNKDRSPKVTANFLANGLLRVLRTKKINLDLGINNRAFVGEIIDLLQSRLINFETGMKVAGELVSGTDKTPTQITEDKNWFTITDETKLEELCLKTIEKNPKLVRRCKSGKAEAFKSLLIKVFRESNDTAELRAVSQILRKMLN